MTNRCLQILLFLIFAALVVPKSQAELPKCDYANSIRVGQRTFEICSWTRSGTESVGFLQVAVVAKKEMVDMASFEIFGVIADVGISDLDDDQNPELHLLIVSPDASKYPELYFLELTDGDLQERLLPELTALQAHGYMGQDSFTFEDTRLVREFPIFESNASGAKPNGGTRRMVYKLSDSRLILESRIDTDPASTLDSSK